MNSAFSSNHASVDSVMRNISSKIATNEKKMMMNRDSLFMMKQYGKHYSASSSDVPSLVEPGNNQPGDFSWREILGSSWEELRDLSLSELLNHSEELIFSGDDAAPAMHRSAVQQATPLKGSPTVIPVPSDLNPTVNEEDFEMYHLDDDIPIETSTAEDIPVAADLVTSIDFSFSSKKRSRDSLLNDLAGLENEDHEHDGRFPRYREAQWSEKFAELCQYCQEHGNCLVSYKYDVNLPLARWVKRQRYQYKLMKEGKTNAMTEDRVKALEDIGFVWDYQGVAWEERLSELRDFWETFGHCNVPSYYSGNPQLATWVKCQRRQYKLYVEGKPSNMSAQRILDMEQLGFEWELRGSKKQRFS